MTSPADDPIRAGLRAWADGDLTALAEVLDPQVELRGFGPRQWDCIGRDQVLDLLAQHPVGRDLPMDVQRIDEHTFVTSAVAQQGATPPFPIAIRITVSAGRVITIQHYRSAAGAMAGHDPIEDQAIQAVRTGDVGTLTQLLADHPALATARLTHHGDRTLLHVATDWPGHFPHVGNTITALVTAGADVNAPSVGDHTETALHWAASSDDIEALDALLDAGADIEATGAVIGGGTALSDATAFGQWEAATRLIARGAQPAFWEAAALGLLPQLKQFFETATPSADDITNAFWSACHGNQPETAAHLLDHGADINGVGHDGLTPLDAAERSGATTLLDWLRQHNARTATDLGLSSR